jgi:NAD(P)-dependent dehydrogenase (short-subunit alcohol dehydrogenase family)
MSKLPTILVTGSNGYLGYPLARRLAERFAVVGFDRRAPSHPPPTADCLYVDLTSEPSLRRGLQAVRDVHGTVLASVIHLAAYYDFSGAPSPLYDKVTVQGTECVDRSTSEGGVSMRTCMVVAVAALVLSAAGFTRAQSPGQPMAPGMMGGGMNGGMMGPGTMGRLSDEQLEQFAKQHGITVEQARQMT